IPDQFRRTAGTSPPRLRARQSPDRRWHHRTARHVIPLESKYLVSPKDGLIPLTYNPLFEAPSTRKIPNTKPQSATNGRKFQLVWHSTKGLLELGTWCYPGGWSLALGASSRQQRSVSLVSPAPLP